MSEVVADIDGDSVIVDIATERVEWDRQPGVAFEHPKVHVQIAMTSEGQEAGMGAYLSIAQTLELIRVLGRHAHLATQQVSP